MTRIRSRAVSCVKIVCFGLFIAACGGEEQSPASGSAGANVSGSAPSGGQLSAGGGASAGITTGGAGNGTGGQSVSTAAGATGEVAGGGGSASADPSGIPDDATVVLFLIDGLQTATTGTLLTNIFEGQPATLEHPRYIEQYLNTGTYTGSGTGYADYRLGMLEILE